MIKLYGVVRTGAPHATEAHIAHRVANRGKRPRPLENWTSIVAPYDDVGVPERIVLNMNMTAVATVIEQQREAIGELIRGPSHPLSVGEGV